MILLYKLLLNVTLFVNPFLLLLFVLSNNCRTVCFGFLFSFTFLRLEKGKIVKPTEKMGTVRWWEERGKEGQPGDS